MQQLRHRLCVANLISSNFITPEILTRPRPLEQGTIVPVPETAMYKDYRAPAREYNVGAAREASVIQPETETTRMQALPYGDLGARVSAPDACHHPAARRRINNIRPQSAAFAE